MQITKYLFQSHGDDRGQLVALEENNNVPFAIKRVYYMYNTVSNAVRGKHAHKKLQQILVCVHGSCEVLLDNGKEKETLLLDKPHEGLYIQNSVWREMYNFSSDAVLMVLASELYDETDYIRDYQEFLEYIKKGNEPLEWK